MDVVLCLDFIDERGKKMKKFIKYGSIVVISLVILISCNVNLHDYDVFAEGENGEWRTKYRN